MSVNWITIKDYVLIPSSQPNGTDEILPRLLTHGEFSSLLLFGSILITSMSVLGVCANIINIRVFLKMRLLDGMTVSFLCLSFSDLLSTFCNTVNGLVYAICAVELISGTPIPPLYSAIVLLSGRVGHIFYTVSILNTVFIALSRYACVVRPLHFKHIFTVKLSLINFIVCSVSTIALCMPILSSLNYSVFTATPGGNSTNEKPFYTKIEVLLVIKKYMQFLTHSVLPIITQVVILFCVVGMSTSLRKSQQFRTAVIKDSQTDTTSNKSGTLSGKELQAVQQVVLLSLIYLLCNVTKIGSYLAQSFLPGFNTQPVYRFARVSIFVHTLRRFFESLNSSANIFIYLKYNRKFLQGCRQFISKIKSPEEE